MEAFAAMLYAPKKHHKHLKNTLKEITLSKIITKLLSNIM